MFFKEQMAVHDTEYMKIFDYLFCTDEEAWLEEATAMRNTCWVLDILKIDQGHHPKDQAFLFMLWDYLLS